MPLVDAAGTVIALVNPASASSPSTTYTYDPSGNPSMAGASSNWPFLYQGMEHESIDPNQFYYSGNGAYYSAQIMRSMSMTSAQGTSGPGGGPGPGQASLPPVGSAPNAFDPGRRLESVGQGYEVGYSIAAPGVAAGLFAPETPILPIALVAGGAAAVAYDFVSFFQDLFGGSPDYPPNYFTFQHRLDRPHGGPHPLYTAFIGMPRGIVVDQQGPHCLCGDPHPCAKSPLHEKEGPEYERSPTPTATPTPEQTPNQPLRIRCLKTASCESFAAAVCAAECIPTDEFPPAGLTCEVSCAILGVGKCEEIYPCHR